MIPAQLQQRFGIPACAPYSGAVYDTGSEAFTQEGNSNPIEKKTERRSSAYDKLHAALLRLTAIVERRKNASNKDISKLTDQILALCGKRDKK